MGTNYEIYCNQATSLIRMIYWQQYYFKLYLFLKLGNLLRKLAGTGSKVLPVPIFEISHNIHFKDPENEDRTRTMYVTSESEFILFRAVPVCVGVAAPI